MGEVDNYVYQEAHRELRQGETIFATGWMLRGRNFEMERFICAVTSQRMLVMAVKGSLMTGAPTTNATNKYWLELSKVTEVRGGLTLIKKAPACALNFVFDNGATDYYEVPMMGQGMAGQGDFYKLVPVWLGAHVSNRTFARPDGAQILGEEARNLEATRAHYTPKWARKVARREGKLPKRLKWPWAMAVVALGVALFGFSVADKRKGLKKMSDDWAAEARAKVDALSKIPKDKLTKKQAKKLKGSELAVLSHKRDAKRAASGIASARLMTGFGFAGCAGFLGIGIVILRRRSRRSVHGGDEQ